LIQVPYVIGDDRHAAGKGPRRLVQAGADELLRDRGLGVTLAEVEREEPFRDSASASLAVSKHLAQIVADVVAEGRFPLVLAGSFDVSKGVLSGFEHRRCGVVWIDRPR